MMALIVILVVAVAAWTLYPLVAGGFRRAGGRKTWCDVEQELVECRLQDLEDQHVQAKISREEYRTQRRVLESRLEVLKRVPRGGRAEIVLDEQIRAVQEALEEVSET